LISGEASVQHGDAQDDAKLGDASATKTATRAPGLSWPTAKLPGCCVEASPLPCMQVLRRRDPRPDEVRPLNGSGDAGCRRAWTVEGIEPSLSLSTLQFSPTYFYDSKIAPTDGREADMWDPSLATSTKYNAIPRGVTVYDTPAHIQ
jgi:hypothetical protein